MPIIKQLFLSTVFGACLLNSHAQDKPAERARDLGIAFEGKTGKNNAITDVPGIEVGYKTLISGSGKL